MKKYILALSIFSLAVGLTACKSLKSNADSAHSSNNSLDWPGVYTGVLPCADCEGIQTVIRLDSNGNYQLGKTYLGKSVKPEITKGTFSWDKSGGRITLNNLNKTEYPVYYLVGENRLVQLDLKGMPVTSELASKYILQKENNQIVEKYWKLVQIYGKPAQKLGEGKREAHFILKCFDNKIIGNGGCNSFFGTYKIEPGNRISFFQLGSTMMACAEKNDEAQMMEALNLADNYTINGDVLYLNKARMAPIAKFEAVYF